MPSTTSTATATLGAMCDVGLAHALPDACLMLDTDGVIRDAGHALSGLLGHARTYTIGKPFVTFIHPPLRDAFARQLTRARTAARMQAFDTRLRPRRSGPPTEVCVWLGAMRDADRTLLGVRCLLRDVTAERATAARLAALEADQEQAIRSRTMELEATVRLLQAQLADRPTIAPPRAARALSLVAAGSSSVAAATGGG